MRSAQWTGRLTRADSEQLTTRELTSVLSGIPESTLARRAEKARKKAVREARRQAEEQAAREEWYRTHRGRRVATCSCKGTMLTGSLRCSGCGAGVRDIQPPSMPRGWRPEKKGGKKAARRQAAKADRELEEQIAPLRRTWTIGDERALQEATAEFERRDRELAAMQRAEEASYQVSAIVPFRRKKRSHKGDNLSDQRRYITKVSQLDRKLAAEDHQHELSRDWDFAPREPASCTATSTRTAAGPWIVVLPGPRLTGARPGPWLSSCYGSATATVTR
jgi:hypothetical protein